MTAKSEFMIVDQAFSRSCSYSTRYDRHWRMLKQIQRLRCKKTINIRKYDQTRNLLNRCTML